MERLTTGVPGLDVVLGGGVPVNSIVMVGGPPGAGKTVLIEQIMFHQAKTGRRALFLTTLSEPHDKLLRHAEAFPWFEPELIGREIQFLSLYQTVLDRGLGGAVELVARLVQEHRASVVVLDAFRGLRALSEDEHDVRRFVFDLGGQLGLLGVTTLLTGEYAREEIAHYVEFTVVDGVIMLGHDLADFRHVRHLEVLKLRGSGFLNGRHTFRIDRKGITVYPRHSALARVFDYTMGTERLSTGVAGLDAMLEGGLVAHSFNAVVGTPGAGKTLLGLQFLAAGARRGEAGIMLNLDESGAHLEQRAQAFGLGWGDGPFFDGERLQMLWEPAVELEPDVVATHLRNAIEGRRVRRLVMDGMTNLEAVMTPLQLNDYIISLTNYLRGNGITTLLIRDTTELAAAPVTVRALTFSATADGILLMRHVEANDRLERIISIVKLRDSDFDHRVCHYTITAGGLQISGPLRGVHSTIN